MPDLAPIDTSTLGPIRIDPSLNHERAARVRDALENAGSDASDMGRTAVGAAFEALAMVARDADLLKLWTALR